MLYLLLSILSNVGILLVFRIAGLRNVHALAMVIVNYITATILGTSVFLSNGVISLKGVEPSFYIFAILIGLLFMLMFLVVQSTTNRVGMAVTSAAGKLSVLIPVIVSIIIDPLDILTVKKTWGLVIMFSAIFLIVYSPGIFRKERLNYLLPLLLFVGMGTVDSIVKTSQQFVIGEERVELFTLLVFCFAGSCGLILITIKGDFQRIFNWKHSVFGIFLGMFNYGSLIFMVKALNLNLAENKLLDSSRIFMFNNVGVIMLSVLIGIIAFRERLHLFNYLGLAFAVLGFYLLV